MHCHKYYSEALQVRIIIELKERNKVLCKKIQSAASLYEGFSNMALKQWVKFKRKRIKHRFKCQGLLNNSRYLIWVCFDVPFSSLRVRVFISVDFKRSFSRSYEINFSKALVVTHYHHQNYDINSKMFIYLFIYLFITTIFTSFKPKT